MGSWKSLCVVTSGLAAVKSQQSCLTGKTAQRPSKLRRMRHGDKQLRVTLAGTSSDCVKGGKGAGTAAALTQHANYVLTRSQDVVRTLHLYAWRGAVPSRLFLRRGRVVTVRAQPSVVSLTAAVESVTRRRARAVMYQQAPGRLTGSLALVRGPTKGAPRFPLSDWLTDLLTSLGSYKRPDSAREASAERHV